MKVETAALLDDLPRSMEHCSAEKVAALGSVAGLKPAALATMSREEVIKALAAMNREKIIDEIIDRRLN